MAIRRIILAVCCCTWIIGSHAATEETPRLSPYKFSGSSAFGGELDESMVTPDASLRAVYDPNGEMKSVASERLGSFAIVDASELVSFRSNEVSNVQTSDIRARDFWVGVDRRTQKRVLLTGNLIVKYSSGLNPEAIENLYSLRMVKDFPAIKTAFFEVLDHGSLANIEKSLRSNSNVLHLRMEQVHLGKMAR